MSKISTSHLHRSAYIYVRQSSMAQVQHNHESQRRQYGLRERARLLGWQDVTRFCRRFSGGCGLA